MKQINSSLMIGILLASSLPVLADEHREEHRERHFEGREIHRFGEHDLAIWRGGHWIRGRHDGRHGWWWVVAGVWYFYPARAAEIPDPYTPPVVVVNPQPAMVAAPQPPVVAAPPAPAAAQPPVQTWYYCNSAKGYYPYIPSCPEGWRQVAAQPPQASPR